MGDLLVERVCRPDRRGSEVKNATWLEALDHELQAAGLTASDRMQILVETDGFLGEANLQAFEHFGPAETYATTIAAALRTRTSDGAGSRTTPPVIVVDGVSMSYRHQVVLDQIGFEVAAGALVALTGPNGAGKSTLLRIIAGLEHADAGTVSVDGSVGYVPQSGGLDPYLRPNEHFALFGAAAGLSRRAAVREGNRLANELGWMADAAPVAGELSGGTRQKLNVITALIGSPDVLLLDEPYQGMDADSTRRFWELLWSRQEAGGTTVVSSHADDALRKASAVIEIEGLAVR